MVEHRWAALVLLLWMLAPVVASEARLTAHARPARVDEGQRVRVVIEAHWPSDWPQDDDLMADPRRLLSGLVAAPPPTRQRSASRVTVRWEADLVPAQPGLWQIPALHLAIETPDGQDLLHSEALTIAVGPEAPAPDLDGPLLWWPDAPAPGRTWWVLVIAGVLVMMALIVVTRRQRGTAPPAPLARPLEELIRALHDLPGQPRPAALRISAALRRFCGRQWIFDGAGATVQETMGRCADHLSPAQITALDDILARTERLCWQAADPCQQAVNTLAEDIRAWVRSLTGADHG